MELKREHRELLEQKLEAAGLHFVKPEDAVEQALHAVSPAGALINIMVLNELRMREACGVDEQVQ